MERNGAVDFWFSKWGSHFFDSSSFGGGSYLFLCVFLFFFLFYVFHFFLFSPRFFSPFFLGGGEGGTPFSFGSKVVLKEDQRETAQLEGQQKRHTQL